MTQGPQQEPQSPLVTVILVIAVICGVSWGLWQMAHTPIAGLVRGIRVGEMAVIELFNPAFTPLRRHVWNMNAAAISWSDLEAMSRAVGTYIRWPAALVMIVGGLWAMTASPPTKWRRKLGLEGLINVQVLTWPVISPITKSNPAKKTRKPGGVVPRHLEPWAEALSPDEWVAFHEVKVEAGRLDVDKAKAGFVKQLGPRWQGADAADVYVKCLVAAFALKAARRRDESREFLGNVAIWLSPPTGGVVAWVARGLDRWGGSRWLACRLDQQVRVRRKTERELASFFADEDLMKPIREVTGRHGFESTAMVGLLAWARERGGVLASAEFLWLKTVDRRLWYPLNGLGGQAFFTEASGAMAHYMAEVAEGGAIGRPRVDAAVESLQAWLDKTKTIIPPLEKA